MARGDMDAANTNVSLEFFNHRCIDEPLDARGRGPDALRATIRRLHCAFSEMRFKFHEVLVGGERAVARVTRDDRGMAKQLGWIPPTPIYIIRMLLTRQRERYRHKA